MKIDSIDIRSFDAKQLTVDFEPPQTGVTVEMFDGALIPSESETYTPLSGLTVTVLFRGKDRDEVQNMSVISMQSCRKVLSLHWTGTVAILRHI